MLSCQSYCVKQFKSVISFTPIRFQKCRRNCFVNSKYFLLEIDASVWAWILISQSFSLYQKPTHDWDINILAHTDASIHKQGHFKSPQQFRLHFRNLIGVKEIVNLHCFSQRLRQLSIRTIKSVHQSNLLPFLYSWLYLLSSWLYLFIFLISPF